MDNKCMITKGIVGRWKQIRGLGLTYTFKYKIYNNDIYNIHNIYNIHV